LFFKVFASGKYTEITQSKESTSYLNGDLKYKYYMFDSLGNNAFTWDIIFAFAFIVFFAIYIYVNRKAVTFEKMLFPVLYAFLFRGQFGVPWMKRIVKKHSELIKLYGYCSIGFGFLGMFLAILMMLFLVWELFNNPSTQAVAPFVPFVSIPVLGYISFSHWIITLFIIIVVHEAAHGLVALAHGIPLKHTGFGIFAVVIPFIPGAFVEPDEKKMAKHSDVVQYSVLAAGPMANFVLVIPLLIISLLFIGPIEGAITDHNGFTFDVIENETYPMHIAGIESDTAFNYINDIQTVDAQVFFNELQRTRAGENVTIGFNDDYEYTITTIQHPEVAGTGFVGINRLRNAVEIKEGAKPYAPLFSWFKGLINLLFTITISLGIINLFPAAITDGGQMAKLALSRLSKNKERNNKLLAGLAIFFLIVILYSIITFFTGSPLALFK
jgi:membrane-associated protease RseP (regulator of RpoE activity)